MVMSDYELKEVIAETDGISFVVGTDLRLVVLW